MWKFDKHGSSQPLEWYKYNNSRLLLNTITYSYFIKLKHNEIDIIQTIYSITFKIR